MKKCPYCAEWIQDEAIFCRFCGRNLVENVETIASSRKGEETRSKSDTKFPKNKKKPSTRHRVVYVFCYNSVMPKIEHSPRQIFQKEIEPHTA